MILDTLPEKKWQKDVTTRCNTMLRMERYNGHFYNWYDTISLLPLYPKYISTVDSGNLVGHLLTLRQGLLSQVNEPVFTKKYLRRLTDNCKNNPGKFRKRHDAKHMKKS